MTTVGVDIGGSGLRAREAADPRNGPTSSTQLYREVPLEHVLAMAERIVRAVAERPSRLTVAVPAFVRPDGTLTPCPSLPALTGVALGDRLRERFGGADVEVVPDLLGAIIGEYRHGAGRGVARLLCVAIGTGVNAAALVDGRPVVTAFGCLGDAGHVLVDPEGPPCPCGGRGCLEAVTSGFALARDGRSLGLPDARAVVEAATRGSSDAGKLLERAGTALGRAMATWSAMVWPERIVVSGGVSGAGELLLVPARTELRRIGAPYIVEDIEVVAAELGADATLVGACSLADGSASTPHGREAITDARQPR
jgi:glucokinase